MGAMAMATPLVASAMAWLSLAVPVAGSGAAAAVPRHADPWRLALAKFAPWQHVNRGSDVHQRTHGWASHDPYFAGGRGPGAPPPSPAASVAEVKGVVYVPAAASNPLEMWLDWDAAAAAAELSFAARAGFNAVRVPMHWLLWAHDAPALVRNMTSLLDAANAAGLAVIPYLFDTKGAGDPTASWIADGRYAGAPWMPNPGPAAIAAGRNASWPGLEAYARGVVSALRTHPAILAWDVIDRPHTADELALLGAAAGWVNATRAPGQNVTASFLPGGASAGHELQLDFISIQNFNGNRGAVAGDISNCQGASAAARGAPAALLLSDSTSDDSVPRQAACAALAEAYGLPGLGILGHPRAGAVLGPLWRTPAAMASGQGLVFPGNLSWADADAAACVRAPVPPAEPMPPPPPPPAENLTEAGGLLAGLREGSRTVQRLAYAADTRWGRNFSFVPPLWGVWPPFPHRDRAGAHHLGDLTLRVRPANASASDGWATWSSACSGAAGAAEMVPPPAGALSAADITAAVTANPSCQVDTRFPLGLRVERAYEAAPLGGGGGGGSSGAGGDGAGGGGGGLVIRWTLVNNGTEGVEVGGLGFSIVPNAQFQGINTTHVAEAVSFADPHPGKDAGHVVWTRADGSASLVVTPEGPGSGLEAWRPVLEDGASMPGGTYEWTVHSAAWESEWRENKQAPFLAFPDDPHYKEAWPHPKSPWPAWRRHETFSRPVPTANQWNPPTSRTLAPGERASYALRLSLSPGGPRGTRQALEAAGVPVVLSRPGHVLPLDMTTAEVRVAPPPGVKVVGVSTSPAGILELRPAAPGPLPRGEGGDGRHGGSALAATGEQAWTLAPLSRGRCRVAFTLSDGREASAHYYVLPPLDGLVDKYGEFAAETAWLPRSSADPFGRGASAMPWDRENREHVMQDARPFVVGLSDDAGAGYTLGLSAKTMMRPAQPEVDRLDEYIALTLDGTKAGLAPPQFSLQNLATDRVKMTLFYWNRTDLPLSYYEENDKCRISPSWCAFNAHTDTSPADWIRDYRLFNFPHQTAPFHAMYRAARFHQQIKTRQPWEYYLQRAYRTIAALGCCVAVKGGAAPGAAAAPPPPCNCAPNVGLMDGTVFREVLVALESEGTEWAAQAAQVRGMMYNRTFGGLRVAKGWAYQDAPYGSEFNWDTTGQEEVTVWGAFFNATTSGWWGTGVPLAARGADAILAYTPSVPNWAYHGSSAGWGDFSNNAKWMVTHGWEREAMHYRAGLNCFPLLERYRSTPDDTFLLETGLGGVVGVLTNIDGDGAPSMGFHLHPFVLEHDPNSGDYGLAFFGHAMGAMAVLRGEPSTGEVQCYMCDIAPGLGDRPGGRAARRLGTGGGGDADKAISLAPRDSFRARLYIEAAGALISMDAGTIAQASVDFSRRTVSLTVDLGASATRAALRVTVPGGAARGVAGAAVQAHLGGWGMAGGASLAPEGVTSIVVQWWLGPSGDGSSSLATGV